MIFVRLRLFHRTPDLHVSAGATLFKSPLLRIALTTRHLSAVVSNLKYCPIGVTSALRCKQYNRPTRLVARVFSVPSNEGLSQLPYRSHIEDTFGIALQKSSRTVCVGPCAHGEEANYRFSSERNCNEESRQKLKILDRILQPSDDITRFRLASRHPARIPTRAVVVSKGKGKNKETS